MKMHFKQKRAVPLFCAHFGLLNHYMKVGAHLLPIAEANGAIYRYSWVALALIPLLIRSITPNTANTSELFSGHFPAVIPDLIEDPVINGLRKGDLAFRVPIDDVCRLAY